MWRSNNSCEFTDVFADAGERMSWVDDVDGVLRLVMHSQKECVHVFLVFHVLTVPFVNDG